MSSTEFQELRKKLELTQEELAKVLSLSGHQAVCNIEIGFRNPSPLAVAVLRLLVHLPERRSKELQELLVEFGKHTISNKKRGRR